jgi:hypothetical protein
MVTRNAANTTTINNNFKLDADLHRKRTLNGCASDAEHNCKTHPTIKQRMKFVVEAILV